MNTVFDINALVNSFLPARSFPCVNILVAGRQKQFDDSVGILGQSIAEQGADVSCVRLDDESVSADQSKFEAVIDRFVDLTRLNLFIPQEDSLLRPKIAARLFTHRYPARIVLMSMMTPESLHLAAKATPELLDCLGKKISQLLVGSCKLLITSKQGTHLECCAPTPEMLSLLTGHFDVGVIENLPTGEIYWNPAENIDGEIVANGLIRNRLSTTRVSADQNIRIIIKGGRIVAIESQSGHHVGSFLGAIRDDENTARIGKLSFGLNTINSVRLGENLVCDEKVAGFHIVTGTPCPHRGVIPYFSKDRFWIQMEGLTCKAVTPDGQEKIILKDGRFVI
ncbi:MAG: hypothetical protein ACD_62C00281G0018 [uncultured bacterium]|nr:MAG: hypothetical protein ACD_62C00281G0018 [uncultured bacterium]